MKQDRPYLAFDIGAGSGRAFIGYIDQTRFEIHEIHRFRNKPILLGGTYYWDILFIWENMLQALMRCAGGGLKELSGMGIDTWNCDFGLLDEDGQLLSNPISYRDVHSAETTYRITEKIKENRLYEITGIGTVPITALSKIVYIKTTGSKWLFDSAATCLPISGLLKYFLTGVAKVEETIGWGSQLMDIRTRTWSPKIIGLFDIPRHLLPETVNSETSIDGITGEIRENTGIEHAPVITVAEHDTVSASVAFCAYGKKALFLSVGTWSIIGMLIDQPNTDYDVFQRGFLNELAADGILLAKSMMGFYILEALIGSWKCRGIDCSYKTLKKEASFAQRFSIALDVNNPVFFSSVNMQKTFQDYLEKTGQNTTDNIGRMVRAIFEGLAFSYRKVIIELEHIVNEKISCIRMLGGGTKNALFCQMVADAAGLEVEAGPAEAAIIGNLCMQAYVGGNAGPMDDIYSLVRKSFPVKRYSPIDTKEWEAYFKRREEKGGL